MVAWIRFKGNLFIMSAPPELLAIKHNKILPVILAGGSGERLWPLSRVSYPKQFIHLGLGEYSLLQATMLRLAELSAGLEILDPLLVCNAEHRFLVIEQLQELDIGRYELILEPVARNTAAAIASAALWARENIMDEVVLLVLPADHFIADPESLRDPIGHGIALALANYLVTFGIKITSPHTGYGYIQAGTALSDNSAKITRFVEKPSLEVAQELATNPSYFWNSGMFMFRPEAYLQELLTHQPDIMRAAQQGLQAATKALGTLQLDVHGYSASPNLSIDYAVMEHTEHSVVIPINCTWSDVGCWQAVLTHAPRDQHNNATIGDVVLHNTHNCFITAQHRLVATANIQDVAVVETADAVLVTGLNDGQSLRPIVTALKELGHATVAEHRKVLRPWGWYDVLSSGSVFKVKQIAVYPQRRLSLQTHQQRSEHWIIVSGIATVVRGEEEFTLYPNQATFIPIGMLHQLINNSTELLQLIEIQAGNYLGEDDIIRYADDYGRTKIKTTSS